MSTLYFLKALELYFVFIYQKKIYLKKIGFAKISKIRFWLSAGLPCGRPLAEQNCSVDHRHAPSANVHFGRLGLSTVGKSSALCLVRSPARSTDREFHSLFGNHGRSSGRLLLPTVRNSTVGGRPAGRPTVDFSAELAPNS